MYRATREFIQARQKHTDFRLSIISNVRKVGGGKANKCFENSCAYTKASKLNGDKIVSLSGWLVQPYDKEKNCTAIIQHWWNGDVNGNHYDTSPLIGNDEEYVLDFALYEYSRINIEKIKSNVAMSLLYQDGEFSLLTDPDTMKFVETADLKTELLFNYLQPKGTHYAD